MENYIRDDITKALINNSDGQHAAALKKRKAEKIIKRLQYDVAELKKTVERLTEIIDGN